MDANFIIVGDGLHLKWGLDAIQFKYHFGK